MTPSKNASKFVQRFFLIVVLTLGLGFVMLVVIFMIMWSNDASKLDKSAEQNKEYLSKVNFFEGKQPDVTVSKGDTLTGGGTTAQAEYKVSGTIINLENEMTTNLKDRGYEFTKQYGTYLVNEDGSYIFSGSTVINRISTRSITTEDAFFIIYELTGNFECGKPCPENIVGIEEVLNHQVSKVVIQRSKGTNQ